MTHAIEDARSPEDLVRALDEAGDNPARALLERIREVGAPCVPFLVELVTRDNFAMEGMQPCHAVRLLGDLRAAEAIEPLLQALKGLEGIEMVFNDIMMALPKMGDALVEPALRAHARSDDEDYCDLVCCALAECGTRDERIWQLLVQQLARKPDTGAGSMANYGDERALPLLIHALDAQQPDEHGALDGFAIIELCAAIEDLGGTLTPEQREKRELGKRHNQERFLPRELLDVAETAGDEEDERGPHPFEPQEPYVRESPKVGRNDPCPCGSGKKFKKCHGAG